MVVPIVDLFMVLGILVFIIQVLVHHQVLVVVVSVIVGIIILSELP